MFKGFYNLTSGMLTQQRNLDVVGNNLVNISTAGFKESRYTATTFADVLYSRVGNTEKIYKDLGNQSYMRATSQVYVNYDQGVPEPTGINLDFAIYGDGYFAVQDQDGGILYTRAGSFTLDEEGYLCFPGYGRVLDRDSQPIELRTDKITADSSGRIFTQDGEGYFGQLGIFVFGEDAQPESTEEGMFTGEGAQVIDAENQPVIYWRYLERSNVDMLRQMTEMITCQRSLQSAAQVTKMYDELMGRAASDVGRLQ